MSDKHEIGYGKPPVASRFKKGQSGNPKGRPRGTKNLKADLREELEEKILMREGERSVRTSKQRALIKFLVTRAFKGDARAMTNLLNLVHRVGVEETAADVLPPLSEDESALLAAFERRRARLRSGSGGGNGQAGGES